MKRSQSIVLQTYLNTTSTLNETDLLHSNRQSAAGSQWSDHTLTALKLPQTPLLQTGISSLEERIPHLDKINGFWVVHVSKQYTYGIIPTTAPNQISIVRFRMWIKNKPFKVILKQRPDKCCEKQLRQTNFGENLKPLKMMYPPIYYICRCLEGLGEIEK